MILSRRAALNGVQLDELDERILICGIEEDPIEESWNNVALYGGIGMGSVVTYEHIAGKKVTVKFNLRINKRDYAERSALLETITGWARPGGSLTATTHPGRKIAVRCTQKPKAVDPRKLDSEYTIIFEAREKPYWENTNPVTMMSGIASSGSVNIPVDGNLPTLLEITVENKANANIASMTISCGGNSMSFDSLGLAANEKLVIDYRADGVQQIRIQAAGGSWRSVMEKRSGSDDFPVEPGNSTVSFTAQRACRMTVRCTGRYA